MNTPVARKLAAADARRVAAARAARAAATSRRVAAAKRRMLLLSVLGALTVSGWILASTVAFPWAIPAILTALTIGAVELGRRASIAGVKADEELAQRVREAEKRAGLTPKALAHESVTGTATPSTVQPAPTTGTSESVRVGVIAEEPGSSLRVEVDPEKQEADSWTPVPVPPPAYTLKAEVRRKVAEPYEQPASEELTQVEAPESEEKVTGHIPSLPAEEPDQEPQATTGSLNVQEILARRRAVG